jgi:RIO-like serine/threonine protein kinase
MTADEILRVAAVEFARANRAAVTAEQAFQKARHSREHSAQSKKEHLHVARLAQAQRTRAVARLLDAAANLPDVEEIDR